VSAIRATLVLSPEQLDVFSETLAEMTAAYEIRFSELEVEKPGFCSDAGASLTEHHLSNGIVTRSGCQERPSMLGGMKTLGSPFSIRHCPVKIVHDRQPGRRASLVRHAKGMANTCR
jgi:hypothetical protein